MTAAVMLDALGDVGEDRTAALVAFVDRVGPEEAEALRRALETPPHRNTAVARVVRRATGAPH